jgi:hypothetical protein
MVKTDFSGSYVNRENTADNSIVTIVSAGKYEQKGTDKKFTVFTIDVDNGAKTIEYTLDNATGKRCQAAWGIESVNWLGKKLTLKYEKSVTGKDIIAGYPIEAQQA